RPSAAQRESGEERGQRQNPGQGRPDLRVGPAWPAVARLRCWPPLGTPRSRRTSLSSSPRPRSQARMTRLSDPVSRARLLPVLGLGFGLAVTVGNAIGAGIL